MRDQRPAAACVEGVSRMLLSAGAADAERAVVVDAGGILSALLGGATSANAAASPPACVDGAPAGLLVSARAADAERAVVVDDGGTRSASWAGFTSANAASAAACVEGAPAGLLVGSLLRDASPALFFIVSACEAGTAAR